MRISDCSSDVCSSDLALDPKTWSGAPHNLGQGLRALGYEVSSVHRQEPRTRKLWNACRHVIRTGGRSLKWESVMRDPESRMARAADVAEAARSQGIDRLMPPGTLHLPHPPGDARLPPSPSFHHP